MTSPIDHLDESPSEAVRRHAATFRKVRQARADAAQARRDEPSDGSAWPEPEVPAREALSDEIPRAALRFAAKAEEAGWAVRVIYSRGASPQGRDWTPGPVVDAVVVRCHRQGEALRGYWSDGKFVAGYRGTHRLGLERLGARELTAALTPPMRIP
jgi:hypothetical protein